MQVVICYLLLLCMLQQISHSSAEELLQLTQQAQHALTASCLQVMLRKLGNPGS